MRRILCTISILIASLGPIAAAEDPFTSVMARRDAGLLGTPTNLFRTNLLAGTNLFLEYLSGGRLRFNVTVTPGTGTNTLFQIQGVNIGSAGTENWVNGVTGFVSGATVVLGVSINTNVFQPASSNLTNWAQIPTNILSSLTNFITAVQSNYFEVVGGQLNLTNFNLTNWANLPTNVIPALVFTNDGTNIRVVNKELNRFLVLNPTNTTGAGSGIAVTNKIPRVSLYETNGGNQWDWTVTGLGANRYRRAIPNDNYSLTMNTNGQIDIIGVNLPTSTILLSLNTNDDPVFSFPPVFMIDQGGDIVMLNRVRMGFPTTNGLANGVLQGWASTNGTNFFWTSFLFQPASTNLSNWSTVSTNLVLFRGDEVWTNSNNRVQPISAVAHSLLFGVNAGSAEALSGSSAIFYLGPSAGGSQLLTNSSSIYNLGDGAGSQQHLVSASKIFNFANTSGQAQKITNSSDVVNIGQNAGNGQRITNSPNAAVFNIGDNAGGSQSLLAIVDLYNYGFQAGKSQVLLGDGFATSDLYNYGSTAGQNQILTNAQNIYNIGHEAGSGQRLTNAWEIYNIGHEAGKDMRANGISNVFNFGEGASNAITRSFTFGGTNGAYSYYFPGSNIFLRNIHYRFPTTNNLTGELQGLANTDGTNLFLVSLLFQPANTNLSNWANLPTNVIGTATSIVPPWTNDGTFTFLVSNTNAIHVSSADGSLTLGTNSASYWGGFAAPGNSTVVSVRNVGRGEAAFNEGVFYVIANDAGTNEAHFSFGMSLQTASDIVSVMTNGSGWGIERNIDLSQGAPIVQFKIREEATNYVNLWPTVPNGVDSVAFLFDTTNPLLTSTNAFAFRTKGTNRFAVAGDAVFPNDPLKFFNGVGRWSSVPGGGSGSLAIQTNSSNLGQETNFNLISGLGIQFRGTNVSGTNQLQLLVDSNLTNWVNISTNVLTGLGLTTNANQFLGAPLSIKDGASVTNLTNYSVFTVASNGVIIFGPNTTNALSATGQIMTWTNGGPSADFHVVNKNGKFAALQITEGNHAMILADVGGDVYFGPNNNGSGTVLITPSTMIPVVSNTVHLGEVTRPYIDAYLSHALVLSNNNIYSLAAGANTTFTTNGSILTIASAGGAGGDLTTNENQFAGAPLSIKNGAVVTNLTNFGVFTLAVDPLGKKYQVTTANDLASLFFQGGQSSFNVHSNGMFSHAISTVDTNVGFLIYFGGDGQHIFEVQTNGLVRLTSDAGKQYDFSPSDTGLSIYHVGQPASLNLDTNGLVSIAAATVNTNVAFELYNANDGVVYFGIRTNLPGSGNYLAVDPNNLLMRTNAGSGTPGGGSGAVQFNESGAFAGTNRFVYDRTNEILTLLGTDSGTIKLSDTSTGFVIIKAGPTVMSNANWIFPTNGMNGNHVGLLAATNTSGGTNAQMKLLAIGSGLALSADGTTFSATASPGLTTNANQFLGAPLSIKDGALVTNLMDFNTLTVTSTTPAFDLANANNAFRQIVNDTVWKLFNTVPNTSGELQYGTNGLLQMLARVVNTNTAFQIVDDYSTNTLLAVTTNGLLWLRGAITLTNRPGDGTPWIRLDETNGRGYTEFTVTNSLATNRLVWSVGSNTVVASQVLKVHSTAISGGINTIVLTNDTDTAGTGTNSVVQTNGTTVGSIGTLNFVPGQNTTVTGMVNGSVVTLAVNATGGSGTNTLWQTNDVTITTAGTADFVYGVTGYVDGAVVKLGINSAIFSSTTNWTFDGNNIFTTHYTNQANTRVSIGTNAPFSEAKLHIENGYDGGGGANPFFIATKEGYEVTRITTNGSIRFTTPTVGFSEIGVSPDIKTNNMLYLPTNAMTGPLVSENVNDGTNQLMVVNLSPGQYLTKNSSSGLMVASNLPSSSLNLQTNGSVAVTSATAINFTNGPHGLTTLNLSSNSGVGTLFADTIVDQRAVFDYRKSTWTLGQSLDYTNAPWHRQSYTMLSGNNGAHALIYAKGYVFAGLDTGPARIIRINPDNIFETNTVVYPSDNFFFKCPALAYSRISGKIYWTPNFVAGGPATNLLINAIDPITLATNTFVHDNTVALAGANIDTSICTDGTNVWTFATDINTQTTNYLVAYKVSDGSQFQKIRLTNWSNPHCVRFDGSNIWATHNSDFIIKVDRAAGTYTETNTSAIFAVAALFSNGFDFTPDYVWLPNEGGGHGGTNIVRVTKTNMAVEAINTGVSGSGSMVFNDGKYVWVAVSTTPSTLIKIDPQTMEIRTHDFLSGENQINGLLTDGQRMFFCTFGLTPDKLLRIVDPVMSNPKYLSIGGLPPSVSIIGLQDLTNVVAAAPSNGDVLSWNSSMNKWTNTVLGGGLTTNANQFSGSPLSIKDGALMTNLNHFGTLQLTNTPGNATAAFRINETNGRGYTEFTVTNSLATNQFVWSVGSNTVAASQVLKVHSTTIAAGVNTIVLTNATDTSGTGTNSVIQTNGVTLSTDAGTVNWTSGVTGYVSGAVANLGVSAAGSSITISNQIWVDKSGSDSTGTRNRPDLPFLTVGAAITNSQSGDVINIGVGRFNESTNIVMATNTTLRGVDWQNTFLISTNSADAFFGLVVPRDNCVIENLCIEITTGSGMFVPIGSRHLSGNQSSFTNLLVQNVHTKANIDGVYFLHTNICSGRFVNCWIQSFTDGWVQDGTNHIFNVDNTLFEINSPFLANNPKVVQASRGTLVMRDSFIRVEGDGTKTVTGVLSDGLVPTCQIQLYDVNIAITNAGFTMKDLDASGAGVIESYNVNSQLETNMYHRTQHRTFISAGSLTNILLKTNGVVNMPNLPSTGNLIGIDSSGDLFKTNGGVTADALLGIYDLRRSDWMLSQSLHYTNRSLDSQVITLGTGSNFLHRPTYANGFIYAGLETAAGVFYKFNPDNLLDYTTLIYANDFNHIKLFNHSYSQHQDRFYWVPVCLGVALQKTNFMITEINPNTMTSVDVVEVTNLNRSSRQEHSGVALTTSNVWAVAMDVSQTTNYVIGYNFNTWSQVARIEMTNWTTIQSLCWDGNFLWAVSSGDSPNRVARIELTNFTYVQTNLPSGVISGGFIGGNDGQIAFTADHVWIPNGTVADNSTNIIRIKKSDLSWQFLNSGLTNRCSALYNDGYYIWGATWEPGTTHAGELMRIDPQTLEIHWLEITNGRPNSFGTDGQRLFVTCDSSPALLYRFAHPTFAGGPWYPTTNSQIYDFPPTFFLPTNSIMRVGAGGIITTSIIGSGLSLAADGTLSATASGGFTTNENQFLGAPLSIKNEALLTNIIHHSLLVLTNGPGSQSAIRLTQTNSSGYTEITTTNAALSTNRIYLSIGTNTVSAGQVLKVHSTTIDSSAVNHIVLTNDTAGGGSGLTTNENQFLGAPLSIKSGALVTNLNEFGVTTVNDIVLTNQLELIRVDLKSIVANKTNLLDFNLGPMVVLTNNLATNSIFILTNTDVGRSMSVYLYGSGILGGTTTNAWQVTFQSQASGTNIVWPIGSTNGNYDILVNSNQYVLVQFPPIPRLTNIWASYDIKQ